MATRRIFARALVAAILIVVVGACHKQKFGIPTPGLIQLDNDLGGTPPLPEVVGLLDQPLPALASGCLEWTGSAWTFTSCGGGTSISGTGIAHVTSGVIDSTAYKGTTGQYLATNSGATDTAWVTFSGDFSCTASGVCTLSSVNSNVGTFGSATQAAQITATAEGRITAVSNVSISIPFSAITGTATLAQLPQGSNGEPLLGTGASAPAYSALMTLTAASTDNIDLGATPATAGLVRVSNASTIIEARNAANSANISVLGTDSSNDTVVGDGTNGANLTLAAGSGDFVKLYAGSTLWLQCGAYTGSSNTGACYPGSVTPGSGNHFILWDSSGVSVNAASGEGVYLVIGGATIALEAMPAGTLSFNQYSAHGLMMSEGSSAATALTPGVAGQAVVSAGSSSDWTSGTVGINGGGTNATSQTTNGVCYYNGTSITTTGAFTANHQILEYNGTTFGPYTPSWHVTTFCSSGCTVTSTGSTYTPTTANILVDACGAAGGGGGSPAGQSNTAGHTNPDGGGGGGARGPIVHANLSVIAGSAITVNFGSGGSGGAAGSTQGSNGSPGNSSNLNQGGIILTVGIGSGGTGGAQSELFPDTNIAGGGTTTSAASNQTFRIPFAWPPSLGAGGSGGGHEDTPSSQDVQAYGGADSDWAFGSAWSGGSGGNQGASAGGYGGGGGAASPLGNGPNGGNGGAGASGTASPGSAGGNASVPCAGGGGAGAGGASTGGTGGAGAAGGNGGGAWIQISEYYRFAPSNDNARPWKVWARARAANEI